MSAPAAAESGFIAESPRQIPVAAQADVVVVGGSSGAVSAAVAAAEAGARVYLITQRPYLGEDLAGTLRLWLEPGESPGDSKLVRALFSEQGLILPPDPLVSLPFTYTFDPPADPLHLDNGSKLSDLTIGTAAGGSVQFNGDVTITADMGGVKKVKEARAILFHRGRSFSAASVTVQTSPDGRTWSAGKTIRCVPAGDLIATVAPLGVETRYVRFKVNKAPGAERMLLAEIALVPDMPAPKPKAVDRLGPIRPLHVKKTLDEALLAAKVQFLYGSYATDVLRDGEGQLCGVVMANRAGRQAVLARAIIDATPEALVARLAGAKLRPAPSGPLTLKRITIAEKVAQASSLQSAGKMPALQVRKLDLPLAVYDFKGTQRIESKAAWFETTMALELKDETWSARAELDQRVRDLTYDPTQLYAADRPLWISPAMIQGIKSAAADTPVDALDLDVFRPAGIDRLWVLGAAAAVPRATAEKLMRPRALIETGARLGRAVAAAAKALPDPKDRSAGFQPAIREAGKMPALPGDVREPLEGLRVMPGLPPIPQPAAGLPVLGRWDVVVIGGGTAGAPAGIAAARAGARTLLIEYLDGLGGVGTLGMIGKYFRGNKVGFTTTMPENPAEQRMEWYRAELRQAGAEVWFDCLGCGALVDGGRVTGVIVATPLGRGVVLAKTVIDATGNSDIAIAAGARHQFVEDFYALQDAHVSAREVGAYYLNGGYPPTSDADPLDTRGAFLLRGREKKDAFDWGQIIDSRERRRIVGDFELDWLDCINQRTFPDSIVWTKTSYDSHGYQIHPFFALRPPRYPENIAFEFKAYVPYRCLLPRGLEGMLVAGLGISAHRDAMPIVRMQPDLQNLGYAAGWAAAMAAKAGVTPRQIDVKALQKHLIEIGNLEPHVLTDKDSYPLPARKIADAVAAVKKDFAALEVLLAQPADSLPLARQAYAQAEGADKVAYAEVLGVMGDAAGIETLIAEGKRLLGSSDKDIAPPPVSSNVNASDRLSQVAWALGGTRDRRVLPLLTTIAGEIGNNFNRYRAVVVSLMRIGDRAAAPTLVRLIKALPAQTDTGDGREILAAVALYRCGDQDGLARRMLESYATGPSGPWAELARQILAGTPNR